MTESIYSVSGSCSPVLCGTTGSTDWSTIHCEMRVNYYQVEKRNVSTHKSSHHNNTLFICSSPYHQGRVTKQTPYPVIFDLTLMQTCIINKYYHITYCTLHVHFTPGQHFVHFILFHLNVYQLLSLRMYSIRFVILSLLHYLTLLAPLNFF